MVGNVSSTVATVDQAEAGKISNALAGYTLQAAKIQLIDWLNPYLPSSKDPRKIALEQRLKIVVESLRKHTYGG
jgi:hypothetical protein